MRVGVEVGGTFTDLISIDDGKVQVCKVPSTPSSPDIGAVNAIEAAGIDLAQTTELIHGSTVVTNAVLERTGAHIGVVVTKGMRDLFLLQRHDRTAIYDLHYRKPVPIVDRRDVCEVDERLTADGLVVMHPEPEALKRTLREFLGAGTYDAVAVCLLHSYANPVHERIVAKTLRDLAPDLPVACSCDISPEFREYERASTTAMAAYVRPVVEGYLTRLSAALDARGFAGHFSMMQSNGGRMPAQAMAQNPVAALFSGSAAGVVGAIGTARRSGYGDIISLDMGGTSTDVSLISGGMPELAPLTKIDGLPVRTPVIDIATVGAGGGSIAWVDDGGLLRVGPRSAGAHPGPACYRRGGTDPTVTDAHLIRGTLRTETFLGGTMNVDRDAARASFTDLSRQLSLSVANLADSVIRITEANIVRAIQQVSTERGYDPREFVLVAYGGAGPLHAARVAEDLDIATVVVPANAGVLSAAGLLMADYVHYLSLTDRTRLNEANMPKLRSIFADLRSQALGYLNSVGVCKPSRFEYVLEMRYVGQAFEVTVTLDRPVEDMDLNGLREAFRAAHHRIFEFSKPPEDPIDIMSFRLGAVVPTADLQVTSFDADPPAPGLIEIEITEGGKSLTCRLLSRAAMSTASLQGPLLIEDGTSTIYAPPGWQAMRDTANALVLRREA